MTDPNKQVLEGIRNARGKQFFDLVEFWEEQKILRGTFTANALVITLVLGSFSIALVLFTLVHWIAGKVLP